MRILVLNSYAGSITLGASALGADIIGSYEDHNFGLDIQKANFPHLNYRDYYHQWPQQDLSDVVVLAHPPCSAFSLANTQRATRGTNSDAFSCTKLVLDYAMKNGAASIAIESVMGALGGAWPVHQYFADTYGYNLYRILENGCMFGAQWRERFWVLYVKKGLAPDTLTLTIKPKWMTVRQAITGYEEGPSPRNLDVLLERQKARLLKDGELTQADVDYLFDPVNQPERTTALGTLLWRLKFNVPDATPEDKTEMFHKYIGGFASGQMCILGLDSLAPVLMGGSHWFVNGRNLAEKGWMRIMGFPPDYVFPETPKNYRKAMQTYLSKGVMPPIAQWIGEMAGRHLNCLPTSYEQQHVAQSPGSYTMPVEPDHIADFRIARSGWSPELAYSPLTAEWPELRGFDERPKPGPRFGDENGFDGTVTPPAPPNQRSTRRVAGTRPDVLRRRDKRASGRLEVATLDGMDIHTVPNKKRLICEIITALEQPTWDEAIDACVNDDRVGCQYASAYWHIRKLFEHGQLREIVCACTTVPEGTTCESEATSTV